VPSWLLRAMITMASSAPWVPLPVRGQLYETTAIPEIRDQAAALAGRLLAACHAQAAPLAASGKTGSAA